MKSNYFTKPNDRTLHLWGTLFNLTSLSTYFYVFMEWLFFVTKPSSLSILSPLEAMLVLAVTAGIVALPLLGILLILFLPAWLARHSIWTERLPRIASIVPALVLSITALVMFDNFTYTVFKFGIVTTVGPWRALYAIGFGVVLWWAFRYVQRTLSQNPKKSTSFLTFGLLAVSTVAIMVTSFSQEAGPGNSSSGYRSSSTYRPNIIILGSDGLSANYLSAYGYSHQTTPFLSHITASSLVAENAFPNASSTTASTTSVLTGKEPATVGVYRYPDILEGQDSFEHLPGILKQYGYATAEIGTPYYVDASRLNMLDGFDIVNNQSLNLPALGLLRSIVGNTPSTYFIWTILQRASERLLHIFFIEKMQDPLAEVTDPSARFTDEQRVDQIIGLLDQTDRPVFIFAHLMDTHGPNFSSSAGGTTSEPSVDTDHPWDTNRYEASIRSFDSHLEKIYKYLVQTGKLDNTVLVVYTDHGFRYTINQRIPVVIHFPQNAFVGKQENNVQIIDIPATLLDYLRIPIPAWMAGVSLLKGEPAPDREIISVVAGSPRKIAPPFYQIKSLQVIVCQNWYALNVQENIWTSGSIYRHTSKCEDDLLPSDAEVRQKILDYLKNHGYDISSVQ
jgi:arylsulfatase A-like enzyme